MQKISPLFLTLFTLHDLTVTVSVFSNHTLCLEKYRVSLSISAVPHQKMYTFVCNDEIMHIVFHFGIPS